MRTVIGSLAGLTSGAGSLLALAVAGSEPVSGSLLTVVLLSVIGMCGLFVAAAMLAWTLQQFQHRSRGESA